VSCARRWQSTVAGLAEALAGGVLDVAPRLLGGVLRHGDVAVRLPEVEAYDGPNDPGSHAHNGRTRRNAVMFGPPGRLYVYFSYGVHWCANVVVGEEGDGEAVLLRAGEVVVGEELARSRRRAARSPRDLAGGPARLTQALAIGRDDLGTDLLDASSPVRLHRGQAPAAISAGPRVGISLATDLPWRFWETDAPSVSVFRAGGKPRRRTAGQDGAL
jgi:DNA-3-methyladenine glycosylase